jgi:hypothetical protein
MVIELFFADQIVPTGELFQAMQAAPSTRCIPTTIRWLRRWKCGSSAAISRSPPSTILDVPVLFQQYGLADIWREAYSNRRCAWLSAAGQDPCNFNTKKEITSVADLDGLKLYTFPTAGRFLTQFGVVPVSIPYEDAEVAVQTGELDGMSWSGITEDYTVGWADVTDYFLTNNISGAWIGSWFANEERGTSCPSISSSSTWPAWKPHTYRNQWYWGGEAKLRATGDKLQLRSVPASEWAGRRRRQGVLDEIAAESETKAKVISIFRNTTGHQPGRLPYGES